MLCTTSTCTNVLKVGTGLGVLDGSLDPLLESVAINRNDHVDLLKILGSGLESLLVSVDVTITRAGRSSVDIKVDCFELLAMTIKHEGKRSAYSLWCS